ncbi:MAG: hypothetical protein F6K54_19575 [Okeania sp. SIO3B5]|uniref:hypothetical protein n=1 Tax=Okeania sp. SIO3B5 TaxID=2607811 RepID=UPI001401858A|nr:hypothetical protein [Okeania sp. SIO3B5]NEO55082.1 hypothetical protein [Okeania sp. SIO3B5]
MTSSYTHNSIHSLKSNLSVSQPMVNCYELKDIERDEVNIDEYIFQILLYEDNKFKLVYGKKKNIYGKYNIDSLSSGVKVDESFVKKGDIEYPTVFFLLKCRKLSQLIASTWLNPEVDDLSYNQITLTRKILDSYNIFPPETWWVNDDYELEELKGQLEGDIKNLLYCITPTHVSYRSISLVLLLCGQAYYKNSDDDTWTKICDPIFTTYETIWEYGLDISWDTYYATRIDISQAGARPLPPFTSVVLSYPPKPNEFSLSDDKIASWVNSNEHEHGENKFPFYPKQFIDTTNQTETDQWKRKDLQYITPPYPYIPLSCM